MSNNLTNSKSHMIYQVVSDPWLRFQGHRVIKPIDAVDVLCAQLTRDLFATAKFLLKLDLTYQTKSTN